MPEAVSHPLSPAFFLACGLYAAASLVYFGLFFNVRRWVGTVARLLLFTAFIVHAADIGSRDLHQLNPATSVREALGALSWIIVGGYLLASLRYRLGVIGAMVAPAALILLAVARLSPTGEAVDGLTTLGRIHISLATVGVAIFALATSLAIVYLIEERNLKRKRFDGVLYKRGIALETLDMLVHRLTLLGFPIFTVAVTLGVVWVSQRASGFARPEYPLALVTWVAFGGLLLGRTARGWRGRKAALLTVSGFAAALLVLGIYLARRALG